MCTGVGRFQHCVVVQRRWLMLTMRFRPKGDSFLSNNMEVKEPVCIREQGGPRCNFLLSFKTMLSSALAFHYLLPMAPVCLWSSAKPPKISGLTLRSTKMRYYCREIKYQPLS